MSAQDGNAATSHEEADVACELCGEDNGTLRNVTVETRFDGEPREVPARLCGTCRQAVAQGNVVGTRLVAW